MKTSGPLRIGIAPDSFKGSLSAAGAAACIARGLRRALPGVHTVLIPMADGGEGTVDAIVTATGGRRVSARVRDPLGRPVRAAYGLTGDGTAAVIEMAAASGLVLLRPEERNPLVTSTFGTGQLIRHALERGARRILVGIGGSATTDGGTGMARALGFRFLDRAGRELPEGGGALRRLDRIDARGADPRLSQASFEVACDVDNPLCGPQGAARVYGPQKGATPAMVRELDAGLRRLAAVIRRDLGGDIARVPGAGAAGGLGAGLMAFCAARPRRGVEIVVDCVKLSERLAGCDLVVTGEGRIDGQTARGKTPAGVARVAKRAGLPVIAICGSVGAGAEAVLEAGIDAYFWALQRPVAEGELKAAGPRMLEDCAEQVGRLLALAGREKGRRIV